MKEHPGAAINKDLFIQFQEVTVCIILGVTVRISTFGHIISVSPGLEFHCTRWLRVKFKSG